MKSLTCLAFFAAAICLVPVQLLTAQEIKVDSQVSAVTLYRDQAMVTRNLELQGEAGSQELVVVDLPENIVGDSLFAEGGKDVEVRAIQFRTRAVNDSPRKEVREISDKIKGVAAKMKLTTKKLELLNKRGAYLDKLETFSAKSANADLNRGVLDAVALEKLTKFSFAQRAEILDQQFALQTEMETFQQASSLLSRQLNSITNNANKTTREAVLYVEKMGDKNEQVRLSYLVASCGWSPSYSVRGSENEATTRLEYNGLIQQMSGENWKNVQLTLSTASPAISAAGPGLAPFRVGLNARNAPNQAKRKAAAQEVYVQGRASNVKALLNMNQNAISLDDNLKTSWGLNDSISAYACEELNGVSSVGNSFQDPLRQAVQQPSFNYQVKSPVTLLSRNNQQLVRILQTELPSQFYYVATPILTSYVYREAELNNDSQTDFMAGPITVYLDDRFVGRGEIPTVARGQRFVVGFGADSQLQSSRELVSRTNETNGGNRETKIEYRLTVENFKDTPADIRIVDRMPVTNETDRLRVTLKLDDGELSEDEAYTRSERSKGILRWDASVPARSMGNTAYEIDYGFTMEHDRNYVVSLPTKIAKQEQEEEFFDMQNKRYNRR